MFPQKPTVPHATDEEDERDKRWDGQAQKSHKTQSDAPGRFQVQPAHPLARNADERAARRLALFLCGFVVGYRTEGDLRRLFPSRRIRLAGRDPNGRLAGQAKEETRHDKSAQIGQVGRARLPTKWSSVKQMTAFDGKAKDQEGSDESCKDPSLGDVTLVPLGVFEAQATLQEGEKEIEEE